MKIFAKKSIWVMLTSYLAVWLVIFLAGGYILEGYKGAINASLGLTGYRTETIGDEGVDREYFKSDYVQKDADDNVLYTTDENGYKHQVYDDIALRKDALEKGRQVQKEGTTILWNSSTNGLPLTKGNKVSLFSHSSVAWVLSGSGSGQTGGANTSHTMKKALEDAGLTINWKLWDFYARGEGKSYTRTDRLYINEVPWSVYTDEIKGTFATYSDAAIIVLSRRAGEEGTPIADVTATDADTPSGDYFDMSAEERTMIEQVVALKTSGTFKKVILLLNTATDMWFDPIFDFRDNIDCCLWVGQTGYNGLDEVGSILVGDSIPSGHLVDTFLQNTRSNPVYVNFFAPKWENYTLINSKWANNYITYAEGIYVGYKYYETRYEDAVLNQGNATSTAGAVNSKTNWTYAEEVAFPFGYGGAYTTFAYSNYQVQKQADGNYKVTLTVKNTGTKNGADAVQIYIQRPYTDYDKQHGIEQASVNLVGYAKTKELAPNQTENVEIIVRDDAFKTYDANNKKTYIREKGTYYITAGQDAHDAVNNILAVKDKTPTNTNGVMDDDGNENLVKTFSFDADDFTTYSVGVNNTPITNQFDDADWNKYENRSGDKMTYLSRNNWRDTYPVATQTFAMTNAIANELKWDKPVIEANPTDEMPLYGQTHVYNLIDLKGKNYNDPAWDVLLNQMTLDEQIKFLGNAYMGTKAIPSIAKPGENTKDGPMGIRASYKTNSTDAALCFPSATLLAASYNDQLALEVGKFMGEDMLHTGYTGIYGTGVNIHRSTYGGRNYEYYSEDAFISGIMCKQQVIGIQSKGCYVNLKHMALNDQENSRRGVATWANEQSIREIYMQAFEYVVMEGDCTGIMSGFNRLGTTWCGAHKGMLTNVLREEWGFKGFVISDCPRNPYMRVINGIMAGNDNILYDTTQQADAQEHYALAYDNPTIAKAMRESTKRVLYVTVNSNMMNGISANTRTYEVREWWQNLVLGVQIGFGTLTATALIITVVCFIFEDKFKALAKAQRKQKRAHKNENVLNMQSGKEAQESGFGTKVKNFFCIGQPWHAKRVFTTVISIILVVAIIGTAIYVPIAINGNNDNGDVPPIVDNDDPVKYKFEAECAVREGTFYAGLENTDSLAARNYPSGGQFVYRIEQAPTAVMTFNVTSSADATATLSMCMGLNVQSVITELFTITVNGTVQSFNGTVPMFPTYSKGPRYYEWYELDVATINLKKGDNAIVLTKTDRGLNFDYLALTTKATLQWTSEVEKGHSYEEWKVVTQPSYVSKGEIERYCTTCRDHQKIELPIVSAQNGYTQTTTGNPSSWTYTHDGKTFTFEVSEPALEIYSFNATTAFSDAHGSTTASARTENGFTFYGSTMGKTFTTNVYLDSDATVSFIIKIGCHKLMNAERTVGTTLTLNGKTDGVTLTNESVSFAGNDGWTAWQNLKIATLSLKAGNNVISWTMQYDVNLIEISFESLVPTSLGTAQQ